MAVASRTDQSCFDKRLLFYEKDQVIMRQCLLLVGVFFLPSNIHTTLQCACRTKNTKAYQSLTDFAWFTIKCAGCETKFRNSKTLHWIIPSLNTRPVKEAKRGPTSHIAQRFCSTKFTRLSSKGAANFRATTSDPSTPAAQISCKNLLIGVTYIWIKSREIPNPPAPMPYRISELWLRKECKKLSSGKKALDAAITNVTAVVTSPALYNKTCPQESLGPSKLPPDIFLF